MGNILEDLWGALNPTKEQIESRYQPDSLNNIGKALDVGGIPSTIFSHLNDALPNDASLGQSTYDFTQRVFPSDIGSSSSYNGHYMVINIAVQQSTKYSKISGRNRTDQLFNVISNSSPSNPNGSPTELSKTDALRYFIDKQFTDSAGKSLGLGTGMHDRAENRPRYTRRIKESIALYMPNSELTFTDAHGYDDISLTKFSGAVAGAALGIVGASVGALLGGIVGAGKGGQVASDAVGVVGAYGAGVAQLGGVPINPKVEILYANTFQREFSFDFLFSPSDVEESGALQQIIRTLRFHAAPERRAGFVESFFWLPPSEFDITFYNRGRENTNIPRINTCVLKQIDVSYAPTGVYATFSNGHPVQIRMVLRFTETAVNDKLKVIQGF